MEPHSDHHYQPGYTLVAAGIYQPSDVVFPEADLMKRGVNWIKDSVSAFDPENNRLQISSS
ncbi:MAG: hypothetical protein N2035_03645 [Chthoniobacterales bacterium]|nr:hypothetical protein [Chthoniobacterales bacterium]